MDLERIARRPRSVIKLELELERELEKEVDRELGRELEKACREERCWFGTSLFSTGPLGICRGAEFLWFRWLVGSFWPPWEKAEGIGGGFFFICDLLRGETPPLVKRCVRLSINSFLSPPNPPTSVHQLEIPVL